MKSFSYFQPTEILFGCGKLTEVGRLTARYGKRCLVVTTPISDFLQPLVDRVDAYLKEASITVEHFDGVIPNPTTDVVNAGATVAKEFGADVVLGIGGGSSMDTAKAIAVGATHPGTAWDYLYFKTPPTEKTLPIIAVTTTSGTGSQVTQVAVMTETTTKTKSAISNSIIYPRIAIVDPELMVTLPPHITASTGFDAFCHAFESYINIGGQPYTDVLALEAMRIVAGSAGVVEVGQYRRSECWPGGYRGGCASLMWRNPYSRNWHDFRGHCHNYARRSPWR
jgi:alcohol dehydrogenase class IV